MILNAIVHALVAAKRNASMNLSFKNKVALVTGAASGMGLATAKAFAEAGAAVTLADIDEDGPGPLRKTSSLPAIKRSASVAMSPTSMRWRRW
jgi:UDP-N-acetylmuramoylalanine-D-glutamate ligase